MRNYLLTVALALAALAPLGCKSCHHQETSLPPGPAVPLPPPSAPLAPAPQPPAIAPSPASYQVPARTHSVSARPVYLP